MKFATVKDEKGTFVGLVNERNTAVLPLARAEQARTEKMEFPETMLDCIAMGDLFIEKAVKMLDWIDANGTENDWLIPMEDVKVLAPIPRPSKNIFCVGKNYAEHAIELGSEADIPEHVMVFTKAPTTVIGSGEMILNHHSLTEELDYEGELAVVIGKKGREIKEEDALKHVFGYTIINDVTARDLQSRHKQFFIGKSLDTTCPMGPFIVHHSAIANPNKLNIQTKVNGEIRQDSNTENFIFPLESVISVLSKGMTLEPGDIIATGTPAGVGKGFRPPRYLKPGDQVEITIEQIGTLKNIVAEL